jgi:hypothetical protein
MTWLFVTLLTFIELFVVLVIRRALLLGSVPVNPASWFGYSELAEITVDRATFPAAYWLVLLLMTAFAAFFGFYTYLVAVSGTLPAGHYRMI